MRDKTEYWAFLIVVVLCAILYALEHLIVSNERMHKALLMYNNRFNEPDLKQAKSVVIEQ
jgi:hypothetical protein